MIEIKASDTYQVQVPFVMDKKMKKLQIGDSVPHFQLVDQEGRFFKLTDELGKNNMVIYFYPKDDTPGCTAEACAFRNFHDDFKGLNSVIIGISADSVESHKKFALKHNLPFRLLSDEKNEVKKLFGITDSFFGLLGSRITFVIDKNGIIRNIFESQININKHIQSALKSIESLA